MVGQRQARPSSRVQIFKHSSFLSALRWGDGLLLLGLVFLAFYAWQWNRTVEGNRLLVEIMQEGRRSLYPLSENLDLVLRNTSDEQVMLVKIQNDKVWVQESNCPLQYCVQRGAIKSIGQWIACLPNQVFIRVLADQEGAGVATGDPFRLDAEVF